MTGSHQLVLQRIDALAKITDEPGRITRTFCSPAMRRANDLVAGWMRMAGMATREDAIGNLIGHYPGATPNAKTLIIGSHLDTVRNAGRFDGPLGVMLGVACVEQLYHSKTRPPFAIDVIGFADEEGVRYQSTYLGSRAVAGSFDLRDLKRKDPDGVTMAETISSFGGNPGAIKSAKYNPANLIGYLEAHIEQGPVLEERNHAVGIVTGIAGQTRARVTFTGRAGHAGTTPLPSRKDALCAAAEFIVGVEHLARENPGLMATVGQVVVEPNASNVIPGVVTVSVDVRHQLDSLREKAANSLRTFATLVAKPRGIKVSSQIVQQTASVPCSPEMTDLLTKSARKFQRNVIGLPSGAGHDAAVMAEITEMAMLFIRCKGGVSHHPDESVKVGDVRVALAVMSEFLRELAST